MPSPTPDGESRLYNCSGPGIQWLSPNPIRVLNAHICSCPPFLSLPTLPLVSFSLIPCFPQLGSILIWRAKPKLDVTQAQFSHRYLSCCYPGIYDGNSLSENSHQREELFLPALSSQTLNADRQRLFLSQLVKLWPEGLSHLQKKGHSVRLSARAGTHTGKYMGLGSEVGAWVLDSYTLRCVRASPESLREKRRKDDREGEKEEVRLKEEKGLVLHKHFRVILL